jgi:hypothetical protein
MSTRNTVYFPKADGPLYYRKATVATYEKEWFLSKGAFEDQDEAAAKGMELEAELKGKDNESESE